MEETKTETPVVFAQPAPPPLIDIATRLRIISCPECAMLFAVALDWYLLRREARNRIICPAGHPIELEPIANDPPLLADLAAEHVRTLGELRQAMHTIDQMKTRLASMPQIPVLPVTREEMARRLRFMANRAEHVTDNFNRLICKFCEASVNRPSGLKQHLQRYHLKEIAELPAEFFT
jgi:hypothetical protein